MKRITMAQRLCAVVSLLFCLGGGASAFAASPTSPISPANKKPMAPAGQTVTVACPNGYERQYSGSAEDMKKGLVKCVKQPANCPAGWEGSTDINTGVLACVQKNLPSCPFGWQGGVQNGKLVCNPNPPVKMNCPASTPDWQWGTSYFSQGWNLIGCTPNVKPAY